MKVSEIRDEVEAAEARIRPFIRETPLEYSNSLSRLGGCWVYLKMENLQLTGSFKLRGAVNKILSLPKEEKLKGVLTASSGNHGMAFAWAARKFGVNGRIYLPQTGSPTKIDALRSYGADIELYGDDCIKAERFAKETAEKEGLTFVSPYNDPKIIGGQGTVAVELKKQMEKIDVVLVPVGGGGLISGIAGYLKAFDKPPQVVGCQPEKSAVMYHSLKAGYLLDIESEPTISDGSAGGIESGSVTFAICRDQVDDFVLVSEEEIIAALKLIMERHHILIEGAAALSVAAFIKQKEHYKGKNIALVLSGAKISLATLKEIL